MKRSIKLFFAIIVFLMTVIVFTSCGTTHQYGCPQTYGRVGYGPGTGKLGHMRNSDGTMA